MNELEKLNNDRCKLINGRLIERGSRFWSDFECLPDTAKSLFLSATCFGWVDMNRVCNINRFICSGCESPIEQILYMAVGIAYGIRYGEMTKYYNDSPEAIYSCEDFNMVPQYEIKVDGKTYRADFWIWVEYYGGEIKDTVQEENIVIECDGYDYHHADKEQVAHDYDRENAIKKAGYTVLRFTGSQIYNDPMKCANDIIDYLIAGMNREHEEYLKETGENEKQLCNVH